MIYLKNKKTGQIGKFSCFQGEKWEKATKDEIKNFELEQEKPKLINKRISYLKSTDWYIIRELEGNKKCPKEISKKRKKTREEINEIEKTTKKEDLKQYENF